MTTQEKAYNDYIKGMKYADIAKKHNVSINTVKSWKQRHKWKREKGAPVKKGAPFFNTNGKGGPVHNHKAVTHGLFAKYLPKETEEIVQAIEDKPAIDILWDNICIKYAAIIRAQKIMYVKDSDDVTERIVMLSEDSTAYQYTEAYEKQEAFLRAQSRAMGTLNNMIKQYEEMCRAGNADEEQQLRIEKMRAEVEAMKSDGPDEDAVVFDFKRGDKNEND
jgi:uncharacterized protein YjcR